jgi:ribose/xylose/arabinose/galactoside ABC-type transport system permease subunit
VRKVDRLSIARLRKRLPLPVFIVVLILLVVMLGFACLCISDHPSQAAERAISAAAHAPAPVVMWVCFVLLLAPLTLLPQRIEVQAAGRASPAALQRFRF